MIGKTLGNLKIVSKIGEGGMGVVYLAEHLALKKRFAVKSLTAALTENPGFRERFYQEAVSHASLDHPNIVHATDFFEEGGQFFFVMEYISGQGLNDLIKKKGKLTEKEALKIFKGILSGLDFAHSKGVIHRDVKPSNVIVDESGRARITDFGIALLVRDKRLTATGANVGTSFYMSPEQILHPKDIDHRSDVYSAGIVLYEMLTGDVPFDGETDFSIKNRQIKESPPNPTKKNPLITAQLKKIMLKALEKNPEKRFSGCGEFLQSIEDYEGGVEKSKLKIWPKLSWIFPWRKRDYSPEQSKSIIAKSKSNQNTGRRCPAGRHIMDPNWDVCPYCEGERKSREQSAYREPESVTFSDTRKTVIRPYEAASDTAEEGDMRPALDVQDATMFFPKEIPTESSGVPKVALTITKSATPSLFGRKISLSHFPFRIGRDESADYVISDDPAVSKAHLILDFNEGAFTVRDAGSSNGSYINGKLLQLDRPEPLFFRAIISLSETTTLTFVPEELEALPDLTGKIMKTSDNVYQLKRLLHSSMKAAIYSGYDQKFDRKVAVKVFSPQLSAIRSYMEQFEREAKTAGRLSHHHICRILDFGQAKFQLTNTELKQIPYLCMELMDGGSLADWIKEHKSISLSQVVCWVNKLGDALQYMHDQAVIHQGIKPTSIVFDRDNSPYLTDFAIASQTRDKTSSTVMGAPPYLAPEQWNGEEITPATDQYSLAVLTYFLVTGAKPYEGQENPDVRSRNFRRGPVPAHDEAVQNGRMGVSTAISEVLARALAIKPKDRYQSVLEFARAFEMAVSMPRVAQTTKPEVFISYHRESSDGWANALKLEFEAIHALSAFIDTQQEVEAATPFPEHLRKAIEQCDVFVCLLAKPTLKSEWVNEEIRLAHENKKPMIPVFLDSFPKSTFRRQLEPYVKNLLEYQGISLKNGPDLSDTIGRLAKMIKLTVEQR